MGNYFGRTWITFKTKGYCAYCGFHEDEEHDQIKCEEELKITIRHRLESILESRTSPPSPLTKKAP